MKNKKDAKLEVCEAGRSLNFLEIDEDLEVVSGKPKITLINHEKVATNDYEKFKQDNRNEGKIEVIFRIKFTSELFWKPSREKLVKYYLAPIHNDSEYRKFKKEAEIKYLFDKIIKSDIVEYEMKDNHFDNLTCRIRNFSGKLELELFNRSGQMNIINIREPNVELEFEYFVDKYNLNDVYTPPSSPSPKKDEKFLTTKKIIVAVLSVAIVSIIFLLREKLWRWWKGENNQEKKVREQLDIF